MMFPFISLFYSHLGNGKEGRVPSNFTGLYKVETL